MDRNRNDITDEARLEEERRLREEREEEERRRRERRRTPPAEGEIDDSDDADRRFEGISTLDRDQADADTRLTRIAAAQSTRKDEWSIPEPRNRLIEAHERPTLEIKLDVPAHEKDAVSAFVQAERERVLDEKAQADADRDQQHQQQQREIERRREDARASNERLEAVEPSTREAAERDVASGRDAQRTGETELERKRKDARASNERIEEHERRAQQEREQQQHQQRQQQAGRSR